MLRGSVGPCSTLAEAAVEIGTIDVEAIGNEAQRGGGAQYGSRRHARLQRPRAKVGVQFSDDGLSFGNAGLTIGAARGKALQRVGKPREEMRDGAGGILGHVGG